MGKNLTELVKISFMTHIYQYKFDIGKTLKNIIIMK